MRDNDLISFYPLTELHFSLVHEWFNRPHVQQFYSLRFWTLEEVKEKLLPYICKAKPVYPYIIYLNEDPFGYIQYYRVRDFPWENQEFSQEIIEHAAGIDLFLGEASQLGQGLGSKILKQFMNDYLANFLYIVADPDCRNVSSLRLFEKTGFKLHKIIKTTDTLQQPATLQLMIKKQS